MFTIIEENQNAIVIALSDTEVGKVILPNKIVWVNAKTGEPVDLFGKEDEPSFEKETQALVHGDFCRPTNYFTRGNFEWMFKNIVQTEKGLRLIDTGFSKYLSREKNTRMLASCLIEERQDINLFRYYYLEEGKDSQ